MISASQIRPHFPSKRDKASWSSCNLLLLLLALAVFAWGTSYKLSLYKTLPPGSSTPAKLCTRSSDLVKGQLDAATNGHEVLHRVVLPGLVPIVVELAFPLYRRTSQDSLASEFSPLRDIPVLHLRPPPASAVRLL